MLREDKSEFITVSATCFSKAPSQRGLAWRFFRQDWRSVDLGFCSVIVAVVININTKVKTKVNTPPPASPELSDTHKTKNIVLASCLSLREPLKGKGKHTVLNLALPSYCGLTAWIFGSFMWFLMFNSGGNERPFLSFFLRCFDVWKGFMLNKFYYHCYALSAAYTCACKTDAFALLF